MFVCFSIFCCCCSCCFVFAELLNSDFRMVAVHFAQALANVVNIVHRAHHGTHNTWLTRIMVFSVGVFPLSFALYTPRYSRSSYIEPHRSICLWTCEQLRQETTRLKTKKSFLIDFTQAAKRKYIVRLLQTGRWNEVTYERWIEQIRICHQPPSERQGKREKNVYHTHTDIEITCSIEEERIVSVECVHNVYVLYECVSNVRGVWPIRWVCACGCCSCCSCCCRFYWLWCYCLPLWSSFFFKHSSSYCICSMLIWLASEKRALHLLLLLAFLREFQFDFAVVWLV